MTAAKINKRVKMMVERIRKHLPTNPSLVTEVFDAVQAHLMQR